MEDFNLYDVVMGEALAHHLVEDFTLKRIITGVETAETDVSIYPYEIAKVAVKRINEMDEPLTPYEAYLVVTKGEKLYVKFFMKTR